MDLNVFYNGTDSNYSADFKESNTYPYGEIVSRFGHYTQLGDTDSSTTLRINGLGKGKSDPHDQNGNFIYRMIKSSLTGISTGTGLGMRNDIQSIIEKVIALKDRIADGELKVNLMGWSRGGIGCIYAAHMISKIWDDPSYWPKSATPKKEIKLKIRIIVFDPVSGIGTNMKALDMDWSEFLITLTQHSTGISSQAFSQKLENWWELPPYVEEFHGFYAHDERTIGFATTMPTMIGDSMDATRTFHLYEVPGTHSTMVGNISPFDQEIDPQSNTDSNEEGLYKKVGLDIYSNVVKKVDSLMNDWNRDRNEVNNWIKKISSDIDSKPTDNDYAAFKSKSQKYNIDQSLGILRDFRDTFESKTIKTFIQISEFVLHHKLTLDEGINEKIIKEAIDKGRGVFLGGNKLDRKWHPAKKLTDFLNESNTKSGLDTIWRFLTNSNETKGQKLGSNIEAYNYNPTHTETWQ